jgi:hypothetical protein
MNHSPLPLIFLNEIDVHMNFDVSDLLSASLDVNGVIFCLKISNTELDFIQILQFLQIFD